jgi:drug/metabolite transporter (DMT)-like permease
MTTHAQKTGYLFALLAFTIFAVQDAISKHLSDHYPPIFITMIRYWVFAAFVTLFTARSRGGLREGASTRRPFLQIFRGMLLGSQVAVALTGFRLAGLIHSQVLFASTPLFVAMLSVPVLGEHVGWRRWTAIVVGLCGVLIILKPDPTGFDLTLLVPLIGAIMSAVYSIATRLASRDDPAATSFFYTGIGGVVVLTLIGPFFWTPLAPTDWGWLAIICFTGISSHYCLIKSFDYLDAVVVQPLGYFQLVLASSLGIVVFHEPLKPNIVIGSAIIVGAGLFTIWREFVTRRRTIAAALAENRD